MNRKICIILPILNEVDSIRTLLDSFMKELADYSFLICIIDDGSTDGTIPVLEKFNSDNPGILHVIHRVKTAKGCLRGGALFDGLIWAMDQETNFDIFLEIDGDLSHQASDIHAGLKLLDQSDIDVAIASKYLPNSQIINRSKMRNLISRFNSLLMSIILGGNLTDYSNGYRLYNRKAASLITQSHIKHQSPIYLSEVLSIWLSNKVKIGEFPSTYYGRSKGDSKVVLGDVTKGLKGAFEIGLQYRMGKYQLSK